MYEVYKNCPVLESKKYLLRLVGLKDTDDLLKVYSDVQAVPYFNSDNCNGDDFFYKTFERMEEAVKFWLWAYKQKGFVRWAVVDKDNDKAIGTIELFNRQSEDAFNDCGVLRLDLRSDYEKKQHIFEILSLIVPKAYELFGCHKVITKAKSFAVERIQALKLIGFNETQDKLVGHDGTEYGEYWSCISIRSDM
mgnify:CR=1 FL=1|nr:GNAT family protein [uncultured Cellulosilyticum sp.]